MRRIHPETAAILADLPRSVSAVHKHRVPDLHLKKQIVEGPSERDSPVYQVIYGKPYYSLHLYIPPQSNVGTPAAKNGTSGEGGPFRFFRRCGGQ